MNRGRLVVALLVAASAALVAHMGVFHFFVTDDAYISFVYSRNLAEHGELVFNLGERVEGYTNFLWTVFLAGWIKLGWLPESSSVVWGAICAIGTLVTCSWWLRRLRGDGPWSTWDAVPALFLAAVPGYACWAAGGLETQLFTFWVTLGSALYASHPGRLHKGAAAAFALAALTRPEGNLFFALAALHHLVGMVRERRLLPRRGEWAWLAVYLLLVLPHFLWRHHYYGYWVPNTFYIKSSGGKGTWERGIYYLGRWNEAFLMLPFALPMMVSLFLRPGAAVRRLYGYVLLVVVVFLIYVASVGGDFMGLFRFVLPVVPMVVVGAILGLWVSLRRAPPFVAPALVVALLGGYVWHTVAVDRAAQAYLGPGASDNGIDSPGYLRWYTEDRAAIGRWFQKYAQPDDYAVVGGAGAQVYYSGMRSLDCFGLSDEYIAHKVPAVSNRPGHEKYAPVDYQLSHRPTVITSNYYDIGRVPLVRDDAPFWRAHGYHYVSAPIPGLSSPWYTFLKRIDRSLGPLPPGDSSP